MKFCINRGWHFRKRKVLHECSIARWTAPLHSGLRHQAFYRVDNSLRLLSCIWKLQGSAKPSKIVPGLLNSYKTCIFHPYDGQATGQTAGGPIGGPSGKQQANQSTDHQATAGGPIGRPSAKRRQTDRRAINQTIRTPRFAPFACTHKAETPIQMRFPPSLERIHNPTVE